MTRDRISRFFAGIAETLGRPAPVGVDTPALLDTKPRRKKLSVPGYLAKRYLIMSPSGDLVELEISWFSPSNFQAWSEYHGPEIVRTWRPMVIGPFHLVFRIRFGSSCIPDFDPAASYGPAPDDGGDIPW